MSPRRHLSLGHATLATALRGSVAVLACGAAAASRRLARAAIAAAVLGAVPAHAANDFNVGIGAGPARGRVDCVSSFPCDHSGSFANVSAGYRFGEVWDVRAQYFGASKFKGGDTTPLGTEFGGSFKVSGLAVTGGYTWRFAPAWSATGRLGIATVRTRFAYSAPFSGSASQTTTQPVFGLGVGYAITPQVRVGVDYDATRFKVHTTRGPLQMLGVAAQFSF